jgi:hypothetical protein
MISLLYSPPGFQLVSTCHGEKVDLEPDKSSGYGREEIMVINEENCENVSTGSSTGTESPFTNHLFRLLTITRRVYHQNHFTKVCIPGGEICGMQEGRQPPRFPSSQSPDHITSVTCSTKPLLSVWSWQHCISGSEW